MSLADWLHAQCTETEQLVKTKAIFPNRAHNIVYWEGKT